MDVCDCRGDGLFELVRQGGGQFSRHADPVRMREIGLQLARSFVLFPGRLAPLRGDRFLAEEKRCQLDRLYQCISDNLDEPLRAIGLKIAA